MSDPIEPTPGMRKIQFAVSGVPIPFQPEMIPKLFVAWVAAQRAEYYAGVDDSRNPGCFEQVFHEEVRHAMRDRSDLQDYGENNLNIYSEKADEIGIALLPEEGGNGK